MDSSSDIPIGPTVMRRKPGRVAQAVALAYSYFRLIVGCDVIRRTLRLLSGAVEEMSVQWSTIVAVMTCFVTEMGCPRSLRVEPATAENESLDKEEAMIFVR